MHFDDPFEVLGLKAGASDEEVKAACEKLLADEEKKEAVQAARDQILNMHSEEAEAEKPEEASEEKQVEAPAAEEKPAEEEKSAEAAPAEEKPAEEEKSAEAAPAEEKPAEEEKSAEAAPAEEKAEEKKEEPKKATPGQIALAVVGVILLGAVLAALILAALGGKNEPAEVAPVESTAVTAPAETAAPGETAAPAESEAPAETAAPTIPADGDPTNETCKGTYTATDDEVKAAAATVVASMENYQLTNAQLQIYYWMGIQSYIENSGPYIQFMGLDMTKPLDTQPCPLVPGQTWQQFFLKQALTSWQNYQAMAAEADLAGREMDEELKTFLTALPDEMEKQAKENGFSSAEELLANNVGVGAAIADYVHFMEVYNLGYGYFVDSLDAQNPSDEQIEQYYNDHEAELQEGGISKDAKVASVRHILISPESQASDEDWKTAEDTAKKIHEEFLAGDKTEDSFAKLAGEHTMDPGSKETGGLYADFAQGQMVPEFDQWSFDPARKAGDCEIVKTEYGYHIMYFVSTRPVWQEQVAQVFLKAAADKIISDGAAKYPMDIDYSSILLGQPINK